MGMYTELLLKCDIGADNAKDPIVRFLFANGAER